jgi:hypothetical protein
MGKMINTLFFLFFLLKIGGEFNRSIMDSLTSDADPSKATLTVRLIKSFEFRTIKNIVLHDVDLYTATSQTLSTLIHALLLSDASLRPYTIRKEKYDTCIICSLIFREDLYASTWLQNPEPGYKFRS